MYQSILAQYDAWYSANKVAMYNSILAQYDAWYCANKVAMYQSMAQYDAWYTAIKVVRNQSILAQYDAWCCAIIKQRNPIIPTPFVSMSDIPSNPQSHEVHYLGLAYPKSI
jgi:hypothetical protein